MLIFSLKDVKATRVILADIWILFVTFIVTKIEGKSLTPSILSKLEIKTLRTFRNRFKSNKLVCNL